MQTRVLVPRSRTDGVRIPKRIRARAAGGTPHSGPRRARPPVRRCAFGVRIEECAPLPPGSLPDKPAMPLKCRKADCQSR